MPAASDRPASIPHAASSAATSRSGRQSSTFSRSGQLPASAVASSARPVDFNRRPVSPLRNTQPHAHRNGFLRANRDQRRRNVRKPCLLPNLHSALRPVKFRRDEKVHIYTVGIVPEVNQESFSFEYSSTPVSASTRKNYLPSLAKTHTTPLASAKDNIACGVLGMNGAQPHVEQAQLVVIEIARIGGPPVQVPRRLQHVVNSSTLAWTWRASTRRRVAADCEIHPSPLLVPLVT